MALVALSNGDVILLVVLIAMPIVALSFLGAGTAFRQIGKGAFAIEKEPPPKPGEGPRTSPAQRESEIRQMLQAKAFRQRERGDVPLDVDAELARLLAEESASGPPLREDAELVAEVRALVEASNARRQRMGREPLDVEAEIERRLSELE